MKAHDSQNKLSKPRRCLSLLVSAVLLLGGGGAIASIAPGNNFPDIGSLIEGNSGNSSAPWEQPASIPASEFPRPPWEESGDWMNGKNILTGIFGDLLGLSQQEAEIFEAIQEVAWGEAEILNGKKPNEIDPYELRLPEKPEDNPREVAKSKTPGILTTSKIVRQRDFANLYDQTTARSAAAPYLGKSGEEWLTTEVASSTEIMTKAGENVTQASTTAQGAKELTSTQDVLKETTQVNALIANQMALSGAMEAESNESLLAIQRISAISAGLMANNGEALDEANRRDRLERAEHLNNAARSSITLVGVGLNDPVPIKTELEAVRSRSPLSEE